MIFPELTHTVRSSTCPSNDARHLQAVQTKYMVRDLIDQCMTLMYLIYDYMADLFRHFPSMVEKRIIGLPISGVTPSFRGLTSATDLQKWEIEDFLQYYNEGALEELPHGCSSQQDELRYVLKDSNNRINYVVLLLACFPLQQRRTWETYYCYSAYFYLLSSATRSVWFCSSSDWSGRSYNPHVVEQKVEKLTKKWYETIYQTNSHEILCSLLGLIGSQLVIRLEVVERIAV